jgi:hypothetical protein
MTFRTTALAAAIAGAMWCSAPFAQTTQAGQSETSPPTSTTQDMQEPSSQMEESTPSQTGSTTAAGEATTPSNDEATLGAGVGTPVDQQKVEQFADAYVQVQTIQQKANSDLQAATDPAQADQVKTQAQTEMIAAVERSGMQIEEFNQMVASIAADSELRSRVSAEVQKRVGATPSPESGT